jgi:hypothetical protein
MSGTEIEVDYLVIGSGAMGMAFTDVLLAETDATVAIVDRRHRPAGHWNDSYPFVRLHQPSAFYGVNSRELGSGAIDAVGWNAGLYELASGSEVCAYFDQVMQQTFLASGRVRYFPLSNYEGDGLFSSLSNGLSTKVHAGKVVDATYMNVSVPSTRPPAYVVGEEVRCVPLNELPKQIRPQPYVVVGGGKTAMDACLFLLENGTDPDQITWIMPRDSWLLDRAQIQPGAEFAGTALGGAARTLEAIIEANDVEELFELLEQKGRLMRLDESVRPTMYRCATVTRAEVDELRTIGNVVRLGRVESISTDEIRLERGSIPTSSDTLHVDCSADGLATRPATPIFTGATLTLQTVRTCQQVFSAAFIAHVEAVYDGDEIKNDLCGVVPHPNTDVDYMRTQRQASMNSARWAQDADLTEWLQNARLDGFSRGQPSAGTEIPAEMAAHLKSVMENTLPSIEKLGRFLASLEPPS